MTFTIARTALLSPSSGPDARLLIKTLSGEFLCRPFRRDIVVDSNSWTQMMHEQARKLCAHLGEAGYGRGNVGIEFSRVRAKVLDYKPYSCVVGKELSVDFLHAPWKRSIGVLRLGEINEFKIV